MSATAIVLGFGPQPGAFFSKAMAVCGKDAVIDQDVARMAGATFAVGSSSSLKELRARLEAGALKSVEAVSPELSAAAKKWLACGNRGISSNTMFTVLTGVDAMGGWRGTSHPHDTDDLDRCLQLLQCVPELRPLVPKMAAHSPAWAALIANWDKIVMSHMAEVGIGWTKGKSAPQTYALIRSVLSAVEGRQE